MTRTITQHRPAYFSGFENEVVRFETLDDLLAIGFVANFRQDMETPFHRFSLADGRMLMAEYDEGHVWWVVGFISDASGLDLPVWAAKEKRAHA
jgi:hypothetical protein